MIDQYDRVPPQDLKAEKAVLGSVLLDNKRSELIFDIVNIEMFYKGAHRKIFKAMAQMNQDGTPIDQVTLADTLSKAMLLDDVGGLYYLSELSEAVPTTANIEEYANIVRAKWFLRHSIELSGELATACYESLEMDEINRIQHKIYSHEHGVSADVDKTELCHNVLGIIERRSKSKEPDGIPSPLYDLDQMTWGYQPGEYWIIAGRPSMGKTAKVLNQFRLNIKNNIPTGFFSLEMSPESLILRMALEMSGVDAKALRGYGTAEDVEKLANAVGWLNSNEHLWQIDSTAGASVEHIRSVSRRWVRELGVKQIIIDYVQLMAGSGETKNIEMTNISRGLQGIKQELGISLLVLSQLSRKCEERMDKRPMLSDLRESGSFEQDADGVIFVYRPSYYMKPTDPDFEMVEHDVELILAKNRNGPVGTVSALFFKEKQQFRNKS